MRLSFLLALLSLTSVASGQTFSADQFGQSLKFPPSAFEAASSSTLLGQPLPRDGIRIRDLSAVSAELLKTAFTEAPTAFGYRCLGDQELLLFPGTPDDSRAFQSQVFQKSGIQPLLETAKETLFSAGQNTFARLGTYGGVLILTACRAARDPALLKVKAASYEVYSGNTPYLITGDFAGHLSWCGGAPLPVRSLQSFTGSTLEVDVSLDGTRVAAGGWDTRPGVKIYDAASGALLQTLPLKDGPVSLTFSSDAKTLLVLDSHQTYTWFDIPSGRVLKSWSTISLLISHLQGGGNSQFLESAMGSTLRVYDAQKGTAKYSLRNYRLAGQVFTPDGKWLVTADLQGVLSAYSTVDGKPGPRTSVGVLRGVGLMPGLNGSEVIVLAGERVGGQQTHLTASAWQVGESKLTPRATAELGSEQYAVMNQGRTVLAGLTACRAP